MANQIKRKEIKRIAGEVAMDIAIEEAEGKLSSAARRLQVSDRMLQQYEATKRE